MPNSAIFKSYTLVFVQFLCIAMIFITGPIFPANIFLLIVEISGVTLGIWAILSMGIGRFNIVPDPKEGSHIVTRGPYKIIRHPMYLSLLLLTLPLVISDFSWWRGLFWLVLLIDLILKLSYEETLLEKKLDGYSEYKRRSYRLIPFIY
jgi:protein-S-isoprenylcysteine O-methyltransferase Ste14